MLSLHKVTEETRKLFKLGTIFFGIIIGLLILIKIGSALKEQFFPTPPSPPTVAFGKLPQQIFPQDAEIKPKTFIINTLSGNLPVFPDKINVYKMEKPQPNLLALQKAKDRVSKLGFVNSQTAFSPSIYQWNDNSSPNRKLVYDIISLNFNITSDYITNPKIINAGSLPKENVAVQQAQSLLDNLIGIPSDIDFAKTKTNLFLIKDSGLIAASSFSNANLVRVDFFQKDIDKIPTFYSNPNGSSMNILVGPGSRDGQIVEAHFLHQAVASTSATYPIKTAQEAFSLLKEGKVHIVAYFGQADEEVLVKNISLGYYLSNNEQDYLMPIIAFEGNNGFYAYVPAIKDEWIGK